MHIAINTLPLHTGHKHRGSGAYLRLLLDALKTYDKENSYQEFLEPNELSNDIDFIHYPFFDPFFLTLPTY